MNETYASSADTPDAENILDDAVQTEQEKAMRTPESVSTFTKNVERKAKARVAEFQQETGQKMEGLVGEVTAASQTYSHAKAAILDPDAIVRNTASKGAAAWVNKGTGEKAYDAGAMGVDVDDGYWGRTERHEAVHEHDQAGRFNATQLSVANAGGEKTVEVIGDLIEGQATQENISSDLTAGYREHRQTWRWVAGAVGEGRLTNAMKTGDIAGLQRQLDEEAAPQLQQGA